MQLDVLWFIILAVLFIGFFFLEGFDYGVGILLRFLPRNDTEKRVLINTIGPVWDGNEVWMITAGGVMFAAFPQAYATMFSGLYLALFILLMALTIRGVSFEFRSKIESPVWRNLWDWSIFIGSLVPGVLWGVAITNLIKGIPIDANMHYVGGFFDLLSVYTLVGGLAFLLVFIFHGASFLTLRTTGEMVIRAQRAAIWVGVLAGMACVILAGLTYTSTDLFQSTGAAISLLLAVVTFILAWVLISRKRFGWAFAMSGLSITLITTAFFWGLFPRIIVSSLNPAWSLTVTNSASSPYTLKIMTIATVVLLPVILAYEAWTYWVFRERVTSKDLEY